LAAGLSIELEQKGRVDAILSSPAISRLSGDIAGKPRAG
jgi:hypothetical protein